ncbi:DUF2007 domain-containing protein [Parahaliea aestuarii]|uniref:DUF2007 domain-containing protein n=1 Tax=Parahaliea aestuarii TaxID=1852021 RepID=A0A5C8ZN99_9GAMM|nr:DUF2007 domain-containing protein [Parahaliea aestuarii]TXS89973.1 DUF2007 domain-containing protein [Parahaliea aestuarii]
MSAIFSHPQLVVVHQIASLLQQSGIATELRNEYAAGAAGELSPIDAWPQLWLRDSRQADWAREVIRQFQHAEPGPDWHCPACNNTSPDTFETCWHCGAARS